MSERDKGLLNLLRLTETDAGLLFNRTRQAVNKGVGKPHDYFRAPHLLALTHFAKRTDSKNIDKVVAYIEREYGDLICSSVEGRELIRDLISDRRMTFRRFDFAVRKSQQLIVFCSSGISHLEKGALFAEALWHLLSTKHRVLDVIAPRTDWLKYLHNWTGQVPAGIHRYQSRQQVAQVPIVLEVTGKQLRGFTFGRAEIAEITPTDAARLWHFATHPDLLEVPKRAALQARLAEDEIDEAEMEFRAARQVRNF